MSNKILTNKRWFRSVGSVFSINPRIGGHSDTIWITRQNEEKKLRNYLLTPGKSICLDGPSGVGKTSLALTTLENIDVPYIQTQITRNTDWVSFCRQVIDKLRDPTRSFAIELQAGLKNFVPSMDLKLLFSKKTSYKDRIEVVDAIATKLSEHDLAQWVSQANCILMVDDFEKANSHFLGRISDLAKILTQTYQSQYGKLLIVGTGDIYYQLYVGDKALEGRLAEVSLGTLPDKTWSWKYLCDGFNKLNLYHPGKSRYVKRDQAIECMDMVYRSCDGLLKTLTELGHRLCITKPENSQSISPKSIIEETMKIPNEIFKKYRRKHPAIRKLLESDIDCRRFIEALYRLGIGNINTISDIEEYLLKEYKYDKHDLSAHIERCVGALSDLEFIVRTGESGEILYVTDPALSHNLGVIVSYGNEYGIPAEFSTAYGQLLLPLKPHSC